MSFDLESRHDEIAVDVPLPEVPAEMKSDQPQGWITEEAFFSLACSPATRMQPWTQVAIWSCAAGFQHWLIDQERTTPSLSECRPISRDVWVQLLKTENGLADGSRQEELFSCYHQRSGF